MIKRLLGVMITASLLINYNALAQDNKAVDLPRFNSITTTGNVHLLLLPSDSLSSITVELHGIKSNGYSYKVKEETLYIDVPTGILAPEGHIRVVASTPLLENVVVQGAAVECLAPITGDTFRYQTLGSENTARLWVECQSVELEIGGNSDVVIRGNANQANLEARLGSRIDALSFNTPELSARAYEGSEIYTYGNKKVKAFATTLGTIYYDPSSEIAPKSFLGGRVIAIDRGRYETLFEKHSAEQIVNEDGDFDGINYRTSIIKQSPDSDAEQKSEEQSDGSDFF